MGLCDSQYDYVTKYQLPTSSGACVSTTGWGVGFPYRKLRLLQRPFLGQNSNCNSSYAAFLHQSYTTHNWGNCKQAIMHVTPYNYFQSEGIQLYRTDSSRETLCTCPPSNLSSHIHKQQWLWLLDLLGRQHSALQLGFLQFVHDILVQYSKCC